MALDVERAAFERAKTRLLEEGKEGKWALVIGERVIAFPSLNDALAEGYRLVGDDSMFFTKQITATELPMNVGYFEFKSHPE